MIWAALRDIRSFTIPNAICISVLAIYPAHVLASHASIDWVGGILTGTIVLAIGFVCYVFNWTGAGDVKLLAVSAVWAGPDLIAPFLVVTAVAGGVLSAAMMLHTRFAGSNSADGTATVPFFALLKIHVPYGTAIAVGGLYVVFRRLAF